MHEASFIDKTSQAGRGQQDEADGLTPVGRARRSALAFTWIASCLLLSLAIMGWLSFQVAAGAITWANTFTWANTCLGLLAVFLLWGGLGALALQMAGTGGVLLTRADAPVLFDALDRLRRQLKGPRIERVLLDAQFHIGIHQHRRFGPFGIFGGKINCLTAEWKLHRAYLSRVRARGQFLAARFRECSADELVEIAELMLRLDVDVDVRSLYERVLQLAPGHPGALRGLVQCLPDAEWELRVACASMLFDNSEAHRCWASRAAVMTLEKHAGERGDKATLQRWHERRDVAEEMEHRAMRELAETPYFALIEASDLKEFEKGELLSRLARCTLVARAWLVRKRLAGFGSRRCYIIFLHLPGLVGKKCDSVCRELESTLELPGLTLAVSAGRTPTLREIKRHAFETVYVRAQ